MATKSWREIQEAHSKRSPEERAATKSRALHDLVIERMNLTQLRRARTMTQATIAEVMEIAQGDVSRLEHRTDAYIGTLRRYIEALGGVLRIVAEFPDGEPIEIAGFGELAMGGKPAARRRIRKPEQPVRAPAQKKRRRSA
jgi:transcriptional regulator with XRE-family HTH domain